MSIFSHFACILYGTWLFLKTGFYILVFREQYLRRFIFVFVVLWVCCSWDNKLSQVCPLIFNQMPGSCLIFHLQRGIWEFHFPFTCNRYGKCFGISVTHLTSNLEVPGSSPGVSNNLFFLFDLSLYHLLWTLNTWNRKSRNKQPYLLYYNPIFTWSSTFCV